MSTTLGKELKAARKEAHMTQTDFARMIGVPQETVSRWESGKREPTGLYREAVERFLKRQKGGSDAQAH